MDPLQIGAGFAAGVVVGAGGLLYYMRYRTMKQMRQMQDQLGGMLDADALAEDDL